MSNLIAFIVVLIALVFAMIIIRQKPKSLGEFFAALFDLINSDKPAKAHRADPVQSFPYRSKGQLLSKGEMAFFHALKKVVGEQSAIAMKVRLADIITCPGSEWNKGHGNRILQKHVDFVLIDPNSTSIQAVIELNDKTHKRERRQKRDEFLANALSAAGILLIEIPAAASYDTEELRSILLATPRLQDTPQ
ncbi:MAG: DUF2726 domain-containing protein [Phycisphaerae bacterium]|nr:DUF2726 domain-containing protein [Phycisphaerales bacterium]